MARIVDLQFGDILTPEEVVVLLRMAEPGDHEQIKRAVLTLQNWRSLRKGPKFCKNGQRVVYYKKDVAEYLQNAQSAA